MSLISMAVHDTKENGRSEYTSRTLECLYRTVNWRKHHLVIVDNNSCEETKRMFKMIFCDADVKIITLPENIGTARALNRAWKFRIPGEHIIKIDNDVVIHSKTWVEEMEEAIQRLPQIGILGLKRKDVIQTTWHEDPHYRTKLMMLPHKPGERWIVFEESGDVIGTCTMFNYALIDKVGYSYQPGLYGFEDVLFCHRAHLGGFMTGFLSHIEIDHIDRGDNPYAEWKRQEAGSRSEEMVKTFRAYVSGERPIYEEFY